MAQLFASTFWVSYHRTRFPIVTLKSDHNCVCETKTQEAIFIAEQKVIGKHLHFFLCWWGGGVRREEKEEYFSFHVSASSQRLGISAAACPGHPFICLLWAITACSRKQPLILLLLAVDWLAISQHTPCASVRTTTIPLSHWLMLKLHHPQPQPCSSWSCTRTWLTWLTWLTLKLHQPPTHAFCVLPFFPASRSPPPPWSVSQYLLPLTDLPSLHLCRTPSYVTSLL